MYGLSRQRGSFAIAPPSSQRNIRWNRLFAFAVELSLLVLVLAGLAKPLAGQNPTPVNVPTWRYDTTHAGANTQETALTPANVNTATFGKLFSRVVDGYVFAQPLYVSGLTMGDGLVHNVLFVATEHDSIYAFDADSNGGANAQPIWQISMLSAAYGAAAGATTVPSADVATNDLIPEIGITGTPAINVAAQTMYVISKTKENGNYVQRLHAINIITGAEQPNSPVVIQATVAGTGNGSSGGQLAFSPLWEMNRGALDYYNGYVYFAFGAHGDNGPWHGWVFGYNATTLAQTGVICLSPTGFGNGVWQSGAGLPIDNGGTAGRLFLATGNGTYSAYPPFNKTVNYGDSIVDFSLANGALAPTDAFTAFNQSSLSSSDLDLGAGGILMPTDQQGANPHILIQVGKEGRILVLNRDNLGGYAPGGSSNTNALQDIPGQTSGLWSTPAYWNGNVYLWGNGDHAKLFELNSGVLNSTYSSESAIESSFPGASFSVSSNGTQNGIAWAARTDAYQSNGPQVLYAFDATNLANLLYESDTNDARDDAGPANKFTIPVVTNGKVYLAAAYQVDVYGLFNGAPIAVAPVISPKGGSFPGAQTVTLSTTSTSANIYYTLDGTVPTTTANLYTSPITISADTVIKAIASGTGYIQSPVSSATFNFINQVPPPAFTPAAGTYSTPQQITLSDSDTSATIYYTLDGSTPTASSAKYTGPITVSSASTTINAIGTDPALQTSNMASSTYVISAGSSTINFGSGFSIITGLTLNGSAVNTDDSRLQLTDGGAEEAGSVFYNQPINVQAFTTDFSFQLSNAIADGFTFTIQNTAATALGATGGALGYQGINKSVAVKFDFYNNAGEGSDSTGIYTNGALPEVPAVDMTSSGVILSSGDSIHAHITYDGTTLTMTLTDAVVNKTFTFSQAINIPQTVGANTAYVGFTGGTGGNSSSQKILSWTYSTQTPGTLTAAPVFTPAAGTYSAAQSVTIADSTPGAVIYYTTNGSTPTTSSAVYSAAIPVSTGTTTIEAIAVAPSYSQSSVTTATYTVTQAATPAPVFTPAAGTYSGTQSVTITDTDASAVIHYTTNGTLPTSGSAVYSGPISVASSTTLEAIAIDPALANSPVTTAAYVISSGAVINYPSFPSMSGLSINGNAAVTGNVLQLTNAGGQDSSAFYKTPVNVQAFVTNFTFQLVNAQADGFTFTLQNEGVTALGVSGGSLGYGSPGATGGITNSVAVKFDIYSNAGEGSDSTGVFTDGAQPTTPAVDITPSGIQLDSGDTIQAQLSYNGTTLTLTLLDTVTNKTFTQSFTVNIPQIIGANTAYAGFTGGTGGLYATQNILNWTYSPGSPTPTTATPTFTPAAGTYTSAQSVTIADGTTGAVIYYTTNGMTPTTASPVYTGAIPVSTGTTTIEAIAVAPNYSQSGVATATYSVTTVTAAPVFTPAAGSFTNAQSVTIADSTSGAVIYYTTNGTTPTTSSAVYSGSIAVGAGTTTIEALAIAPNLTQSPVTTATYKVTPVTTAPAFTPAAGSYTAAQSVTITDSTSGAVIYYTTNGTTPTTSSSVYSGAVAVGAGTTTLEALALAPNYSQSAVTTSTYKVTPVTAAPTFTPAAGSYSAVQSVTIADSTTGAVIYYTTNGTTPTTSSSVYSGAISVAAGTTTIEALAVAANYSQSAITTGTYKVTLPVTATPAFTPAAGSYTAAQSVTITDSTTGAVIYYTTNGTTPTTSSTVYSGAIAVGSGTTTIEALALAPNDSQSPVSSATYKVTTVTATPTFTPAAGSYTAAQSVTIADSTTGAVIYYTTNGTTPTTSSSVYGGAIAVGAGTTTIEALAVAPNYSQSAVATAIYKVTPVTAAPALTPAAGSYSAAQSVTVADATSGAAIYYTTNGTTPTTSSTLYTGAIAIGAGTTTIEALAIAPNYSQSAVTSGTYKITLPVTSAPVFTPLAGSYNSAQSVTIADATIGAVIYYTTNGTTPTTSSAVYSTGIPVSTGTTTIEAIALAPSYSQSSVTTATYTVTLPVTPAPVFTPASGTYASLQSVTIADTDTSAVVHYTTNGTAPNASSTTYSGPIAVTSSTTIEAIAIDPALANSPVTTAAYVISSGAAISYGSFPSTSGLSINGNATVTGNILQLTNNGGQDSSAFYKTPVNVQSFVTNFTFQLVNAQADGFTFTMQNQGPTALGVSGGSLGYGSPGATGGITNSVAVKFDIYSNAGEGSDSTGLFIDGAQPTTPAIDITPSGIQLSSGDTIQAQLSYNGTTLTLTLLDTVTNKTFNQNFTVNIPQIVGANTAYVGFTAGTGGLYATQNVLNWTYTVTTPTTPVTSAPAFTPGAGAYSAAQSVTIADATAGAVIYYTTNGTTPTTSSAVYSAAIPVSSGTTTIEALALAPNNSQSSVTTATYTIAPPVTPAPVFTPLSGTYSSAQSVTIADTDAGAVIYYTTNGATPTPSSTIYNGPIPVSSSTTVEAIAIDPALTNSPVTTAAYVISSGASINYASFPSASGLTINGNAAVTGNMLQLTNAGGQDSSAFFNTPVNVQSFVTNFTFQLVNAQADGFTFTLQNQGPTALGVSGGSLGYGSPGSTGGITNSVAVKFDIYSNAGEGSDSTGVFTNGAQPTTPAIDITPSGIQLSSGDTIQAQLSYNGTTLTLTLLDTVTNKTFTQGFIVNIPQIVGANTAYAGFTAGTGGLYATQNILNWTYTVTSSQAMLIPSDDRNTISVAAFHPGRATYPSASILRVSAWHRNPSMMMVKDYDEDAAWSSHSRAVVAEPKFKPAPGALSSATDVELLSDTPDAVIFYTVDGAQPTRQSPVYHAPITVSGTALTIKAFASASGMKDSPVVTGNYHIRE